MPKVVNIFPPLLPGDQVGVQGTAWLSRAILWFERFLPNAWNHRHKPRCSHWAIVYDPHFLIEAVGRIRMAPLCEYNNTRVVIYRRQRYADWQKKIYVGTLLEQWDSKYGWGKLVLLALDALFRTYWFTQRFGVTSYKVCSEFAAWGWQQTFGSDMVPDIDWKNVSPDLLDDFCRSNPDVWECIYDSIDEVHEN